MDPTSRVVQERFRDSVLSFSGFIHVQDKHISFKIFPRFVIFSQFFSRLTEVQSSRNYLVDDLEIWTQFLTPTENLLDFFLQTEAFPVNVR